MGDIAVMIIETPTFTRRVSELLTDEDYRKLQIALINRPQAGVVVFGKYAGRHQVEVNAVACGSSTIGLSNQNNSSCFSCLPKMNVMT